LHNGARVKIFSQSIKQSQSVQIEEMESFGDSGYVAPSRRLKEKAASTIAVIGWLLIGSSLNAIVFNSFPLKLATPEWQLSLIAALITSSTSLLVGATLIILSLVFNPKDKILQNWNLTVTRLASWLVIVLVLSIPLQYYLGSRAIKNQTNSSYEAIKNLRSIARGISAVKSENDLRLYVASLPNAPTLPAKFDAAFPVIKQRAIENIQAQINKATENTELQKSQATQVFLKEAIRNTAQAIMMAAAFSALAAFNTRTTNAVTKLFTHLL